MSRRRVLIVDDCPEPLEALHLIVGAWGEYDVEIVATGAGGLATFAARIADIVLIDLALPDMDGCDVIREMRSAGPATVIVAQSGYALRDSAFAAGANAFIVKPNWRRSKKSSHSRMPPCVRPLGRLTDEDHRVAHHRNLVLVLLVRSRLLRQESARLRALVHWHARGSRRLKLLALGFRPKKRVDRTARKPGRTRPVRLRLVRR